MASKSSGEKVSSTSSTNQKGMTTTKVVPLVVLDGKLVMDTDTGIVQ